MTRMEWDAERHAVRPSNVQHNFTRASGAQAIAAHERMVWLLFGVTDAASAALSRAQKGEIKLTEAELQEITWRLNSPVHHVDVIKKALAESLPVPEEILIDYRKQGLLPNASRVVIYSEQNGVYLGECLGMGFWSNLDPAAQPSATTFKDEPDARDYISEKLCNSFPDDVTFVSIEADHHTPYGSFASVEACVKAGLPAWLHEQTVTLNAMAC